MQKVEWERKKNKNKNPKNYVVLVDKFRHKELEWTTMISIIISPTLGWWWWPCRGPYMPRTDWMDSIIPWSPPYQITSFSSSSRPFCWLSRSDIDQMPRRLQQNPLLLFVVEILFSLGARQVISTWLFIYLFIIFVLNGRLTNWQRAWCVHTTLHVKGILFIYLFSILVIS